MTHPSYTQTADLQRRRNERRKNVGAGRQFLEVEAEVSSDNQSEDDEDGSDLDDMDDSFINDATQGTQAVQDGKWVCFLGLNWVWFVGLTDNCQSIL